MILVTGSTGPIGSEAAHDRARHQSRLCDSIINWVLQSYIKCREYLIENGLRLDTLRRTERGHH
jgi:hypothetical protein